MRSVYACRYIASVLSEATSGELGPHQPVISLSTELSNIGPRECDEGVPREACRAGMSEEVLKLFFGFLERADLVPP